MKQLVRLKLKCGELLTGEQLDLLINAYEIGFQQARETKPFDTYRQMKWRSNMMLMCTGMLNVLVDVLNNKITAEKSETELIYNGLFYDSYRNLKEICVTSQDVDEEVCYCGDYSKRGKYLDQLIISYFVRDMNEQKIIIPKDIHRLCFKFYYGCRKIFYKLDDEEIEFEFERPVII